MAAGLFTEVKAMIILIGASSQGRVTLDVLQDSKAKVAGFLDDNEALLGRDINGKRVLGKISEAKKMSKKYKFIICMGSNYLRKAIRDRLNMSDSLYGNAIHPSSVILKTASIGYGNMIFANSFIGSNAKIGNHVIVNNGALIEHDSVIEDFVNISTGCCMGGRVVIEKGAFLSVGVTLNPRVKIGANSIIGSGSVVVKDIPSGVLAFGMPARVIRQVSDADMWNRLL